MSQANVVGPTSTERSFSSYLKSVDVDCRIVAGVRQPHKERMITALLQLHYQVYETPNTALHSLHTDTSPTHFGADTE